MSSSQSAIADLKVRADSGDVGACHSLGEKYRVDIELRDLKEAARYYKLAAEKQDAEGQFSLGYAFEYGEGVQMKDLRQAVKYYKLAAAQGHAGAQCNLAYLHEQGQGTPLDATEALRLYKLSAAQRNIYAMNQVQIYERVAYTENFIKEFQAQREKLLGTIAKAG